MGNLNQKLNTNETHTCTASVAAYVYAGEGDVCEDLGEYDPKCIPEALEGPENWRQRWAMFTNPRGRTMEKGLHAVKWSQIRNLPLKCRQGARHFDQYCHQY